MSSVMLQIILTTALEKVAGDRKAPTERRTTILSNTPKIPVSTFCAVFPIYVLIFFFGLMICDSIEAAGNGTLSVIS